MRAFARSLAAFTGRHRRLVLVVWLALVVAAVPLAARQTENLTGGGFEVPGTQSAAVERAMQRDFEQRAGSDSVGAVLRAEPGAPAEARAAAVDRLAAAVAEVDTLALDPAAAERAKRELGRAGLAIVPIQASADTSEQIDAAVELREALAPGEAVDGVTPYLVGQPAAWAGLQELTREDLEEAELTGFPIVALILVAVFGSLAAAALPLALGFAAVIVTGAVIYLLSLQMEMSVFVTNMASMIGIGVAVDYSLFVLARYREEIARGLDPDAARAEALSTSGLAVAFSGMAVIVSLAGIWMVDNQALRSMALGAIVVVAIAIVAAVVLLPAVIGLLGHRVEGRGLTDAVRRRLRVGRPAQAAGAREGFWHSWTARVMRRPWLSVACAAGALLLLASPVLSLQTRQGALSEFPRDHDVRVGVELVREATGGGADPVRVVAEFGDEPGAAQAARSELADLRSRLAADPAVAGVGEWAPNEAGTRALLDVFTVQAADTEETLAFVQRARAEIVPQSALAGRANVGGEGARIWDVRDLITGSMGQILAFILGLSFVLLMLMLRSVLAQGRRHEPALDRRRVRRARRGLPVGLARRLRWLRERGRARHDQPPADRRRRVRALDGLRGLPALADPRALPGPRRQPARRRRGARQQRAHHLLGRADHDLRVRGVRAHRRAVDQGARHRSRDRDRPGRDGRASRPRPGGDAAHGPLELVAAGLARPDPPRPRLRERGGGSPAGGRRRRGLRPRRA